MTARATCDLGFRVPKSVTMRAPCDLGFSVPKSVTKRAPDELGFLVLKSVTREPCGLGLRVHKPVTLCHRLGDPKA